MKALIGIGLVLLAALFNALGALYFKKASGKLSFNIFKLIKNKILILGIFLYGLSTLVGVPAYRFAELSLLYPFIATSHVWTCLLSVKYLGERMNKWKWTGIVMILIGVSLIGLGN